MVQASLFIRRTRRMQPILLKRRQAPLDYHQGTYILPGRSEVVVARRRPIRVTVADNAPSRSQRLIWLRTGIGLTNK